jgi:8-oxo-dGTP pyrophosphatase MutT (NUDIX family)
MATVSSPIQQAAAIPFWSGRVCLVTSRSGKRWVVPKGCLEADKTLGQIALQEAWEEAGLVGFLEDEAVGTYHYKKSGSIYHVTVFRMHVTEMAKFWPESGLRQRIWVAEDKAHKRVDPAGLRDVLRRAQMLCPAI